MSIDDKIVAFEKRMKSKPQPIPPTEHIILASGDKPEVHVRIFWQKNGSKYSPTKLQWALENG